MPPGLSADCPRTVCPQSEWDTVSAKWNEMCNVVARPCQQQLSVCCEFVQAKWCLEYLRHPWRQSSMVQSRRPRCPQVDSGRYSCMPLTRASSCSTCLCGCRVVEAVWLPSWGCMHDEDYFHLTRVMTSFTLLMLTGSAVGSRQRQLIAEHPATPPRTWDEVLYFLVPEMTYKVSSGTLNLCSLTHSLTILWWDVWQNTNRHTSCEEQLQTTLKKWSNINFSLPFLSSCMRLIVRLTR